MAVMLISGIILGSLIALTFLAFENYSPFDIIDTNFSFQLTVLFFCVFPLFFKFHRSPNNEHEFLNMIFFVEFALKHVYRTFKYPNLDLWESVLVGVLLPFFVIIGIFAFYIGQTFLEYHYKIVEDSYRLAEYKILSSSDRQVYEAVRTLLGTLLAICVAIEVFIINQLLSLLLKAKSRENFQKIDQKLEIILNELKSLKKV